MQGFAAGGADMNAVTLQTTCGGVISFVDAKADAALLLEALRQAEPARAAANDENEQR